jgi:formate/nitrite transporter FocA (FNT family)
MSNCVVERLDHLGIVAGVCQEMGLVEYFDRLDEQTHARVSLRQAVLAMVLKGWAWSIIVCISCRSSLRTNPSSV